MDEPRWSDIAVLYRRHAHRLEIVDRLRRADIPYSVIGATGLFVQPEVRDLESALRVLADPADSVNFTRLLTAGPWRFDAGEIMELRRRADWDRRPMSQAARELLEASRPSEVAVDAAEPAEPVAALLRAKLERLFGVIDDLIPRALREGPAALLEEFVVRTNLVHDLIASGTPEAQRRVLNIARFMRFAADHQSAHRRDSLREFIDYVDLYQGAGGDLEIEAPVSARADGVQLMTIYQAKGLEWPVVFVPRIVNRVFPDTRAEQQLLPLELLKQTPPPQHAEEEERRLFFVAMTRARDRLFLTTIDKSGGNTRPSPFIGEVAPQLAAEREEGAPAMPPGDVVVVRREERDEDTEPAASDETATLEKLMPVPEPFEKRYALRRQAIELMGTLEQLDPGDKEAHEAVIAELVTVARDAAGAANEDRSRGVDPLTLRVLAAHGPAGEELLKLAPLPYAFSHSQFWVYDQCHLRYAFDRLYKIPSIERKGFFEFGTMVHSAFEDFVNEARTAKAAGATPPDFTKLQAAFDEHFDPANFSDETEAGGYERRSTAALRAFYERELKSAAEAIGLERPFTLELEAPDGYEPIRVNGVIDRIDRHPDGSIEIVDYKTGRTKSQADVDRDDQLSTYALAMAKGAVTADDVGEVLPAAEKLTLYFTESDTARSTTRTLEQLAGHEAKLIDTAMSMRGGDFTATMERWGGCDWCDFNRICPSRQHAPAG
jgi:ATP-dependent exoDNAse (exonuclease V) beta subunit